MRFTLFIHPGLPPSTEENLIPSREAIESMSRYNRQLREAGVLLDVNGRLLRLAPEGHREVTDFLGTRWRQPRPSGLRTVD